MLSTSKLQSKNQKISLPILSEKKLSLHLKREDLIHPFVSGNKFRKLKYNLIEATEQGHQTLLTFGGAYSNHIAATAFAGNEKGFRTIGIIRGEELSKKWQDNPTLKFAYEQGMHFKFISRVDYRQKNSTRFLNQLKTEFGAFYLLPEGGTNVQAVRGCEELLTSQDEEFNVICACVGTGGTISGIVNSSTQNQRVLGFPALRGDFLKQDIRKFVKKENWKLVSDYDFGGYAKINKELVLFINRFKSESGIALDPVYTGKMLFGILDMIRNDEFKSGTKILAIHSGGLQGIAGMNQKLKKKNLPLLIV